MKTIPVSGPSITKKEIDYVTDAVKTAWYGNANFYHNRFEKAFADYIGVKYAVCLPSCTSAIHLALAARGIGKGDEVIVPDATWIATAAPITYVGATTVFADMDPLTWCMAPDSLERCITSRTKAVIPVGLYGSMPDFDAIRRIARKHGLFIIEDAAEAMGSEYHSKKAGSLGDVGVFSFHGSKTMTTGEGGMLTTNDKKIFERILFLRDHGRSPGDVVFYNTEVAYKYKMSSMQAALGLAQLERIDALIKKKREIFNWYSNSLKGVESIALNAEPDNTLNSYWMITAVWMQRRGPKKEVVLKRMIEKGVSGRPFFYPLSSLPAFANTPSARWARKHNSISYSISPFAINLPCGLNMTQTMVKKSVKTFLEALKGQ